MKTFRYFIVPRTQKINKKYIHIHITSLNLILKKEQNENKRVTEEKKKQ